MMPIALLYPKLKTALGQTFLACLQSLLGTGVGAGLVVNRKLWAGAGGLAGEWGHVSLPWPRVDWGEVPVSALLVFAPCVHRMFP